MNGGKSWCKIAVLGKNDLNADAYDEFFKEVKFIDENKGYGLKASGGFYETDDGGETWKKVTDQADFTSMYVTENGRFLLTTRNAVYEFYPPRK